MKSLRPFSTVFALALFAGCTRQAPDSGAGPSLPPLKAQVAVVHLETVPVLTEITGTVHAVERAQLAAKVMGSIDTMPFTLGQHVKRGDTLATISAGEINARVAQAESRFNQANRDLARERELLPEGASTATMVKDLEDRCAGDEAILREAKVMLSYATLQAPFDGVITQKFASVGDLASPGLPLLAIEGSNGFEVQAGVPDSLAFDLSVGKLLVVQTSTSACRRCSCATSRCGGKRRPGRLFAALGRRSRRTRARRGRQRGDAAVLARSAGGFQRLGGKRDLISGTRRARETSSCPL